MMDTCPVCDKLYDIDGYREHGFHALYFCKCGSIIDENNKVIPVARVDMHGLENQGRGLFIRATRLKPQGVVRYLIDLFFSWIRKEK